MLTSNIDRVGFSVPCDPPEWCFDVGSHLVIRVCLMILFGIMVRRTCTGGG